MDIPNTFFNHKDYIKTIYGTECELRTANSDDTISLDSCLYDPVRVRRYLFYHKPLRY